MAEIKLKIASVVIGSGEGGGSGVAPYYADLPDKPSINGETLSGAMTSEDLGLASSSQSVPTGGTTGQVLAKKSNADNDVQWVNQESGQQGTTNYANLENKPQINSVTLSGNKSALVLGLATATQGSKADSSVQNITRGGSTLQKENGVVDIPQEIENVAVTSVAAGGNPTVDLTDGTLTFGIPSGANGQDGVDAVNPFKGYFGSLSDLQTEFPTGQTGDFANVYDTTDDKTYRYVWDSSLSTPAWVQALDSSSNPIEVTPDTATFSTGQSVVDVPIDNSNLANPASGALALAEVAMLLKQQLRGATLEETQVTTLTEVEKAINGSTGDLCTDSYGTHVVITLNGASRVRFLAAESSGSSYPYGYCFYNGNGDAISGSMVLYTVNTYSATRKSYEIIAEVPENAVTFKFSISSLNRNSKYCYLESGNTVVETIDNLDKKTFGYDTETVYNRTITSSSITSNAGLRFYGAPTTDLDGNVTVLSNANHSYATEYIRQYKGGSLKITKGSNDCRFIIAKKSIPNGNHTLGDLVDGDYLSEYHNNNGQWSAPKGISAGTSPLTLTIPDDAFILYVCIHEEATDYNRTPSSIEFNKTSIIHTDGKFDEVEGQIKEIDSKVNVSSKSCPIAFVQGNLAQTIGEKATIVEDDKRLVSTPINLSTGFYVEPSEEYGIERVLLYDKNDILVSDRELYTSTFINGFKNWGTMQITPNYSVRIVFRRPDGKNVSVNDNVVKTFVLMDDSRFAMVIPEKYNEFRSRLMEIGNVVWTPIKNVVGAFGSTTWYKEDETVRGLNYSEPSEFSHYVGQHVSVRTFLSTLKNPWSVLYTENIASNKNVSKYGYTYSGFASLSAAFYGTVCTGLTSYVANYPSILTSAQWNSDEVTLYAKGNHTHPYGWLVDGNNTGYDPSRDLEGNEDWIKQLNPMDFVWNTGHCSVISDVFVDKFDDDNRFLVWAEQTTPRTRMQVYSAKRFINRLVSIANSETDDSTPLNPQYKEWAIYKLKDNQRNKITKIKKDDFVQMSFTDFEPKDVIVDEEIMVFKGDYCAVGKDITDNGESWNSDLNDYKLYLNVKRGTKYTSVEIYDEDAVIGTDSPVKTIDITNSDTDNALDTTLANSLYGDNEEGWVLVNVANQNLNEGRYKARAVATGVNSGFCHFEIVDINFDVEHVSGYDYKCTFSSTEGTPYLLRQERVDGFSTKYIEISSSDVENGYLTFRVSDTSFNTYRYIKLFVKGEYGTVVKRIDVYNIP